MKSSVLLSPVLSFRLFLVISLLLPFFLPSFPYPSLPPSFILYYSQHPFNLPFSLYILLTFHSSSSLFLPFPSFHVFRLDLSLFHFPFPISSLLFTLLSPFSSLPFSLYLLPPLPFFLFSSLPFFPSHLSASESLRERKKCLDMGHFPRHIGGASLAPLSC